MKFESFINEQKYLWEATQDSEHTELEIITSNSVSVFVQVEVGVMDSFHNEKFFRGDEQSPLTEGTVINVIKLLIDGGYFATYEDSDVGLIYTEKEGLIEN